MITGVMKMKTLPSAIVRTRIIICLALLALLAIAACGRAANNSLSGSAGSAPSDSVADSVTNSQSDSSTDSVTNSQTDSGVDLPSSSPLTMAQSPSSALDAVTVFISALPIIAIVALLAVIVFAVASLSAVTSFWLKTRTKSVGAGG